MKSKGRFYLFTLVIALLLAGCFAESFLVSTKPIQAASSSCKVAPVDPKATRQARNLLCYLYSVYGNHILSGQQESPWNQKGQWR